jgi:hypothetical protein
MDCANDVCSECAPLLPAAICGFPDCKPCLPCFEASELSCTFADNGVTCTDNSDFVDTGGYQCEAWLELDCVAEASTWYAQDSQALVENCPLSCAMCEEGPIQSEVVDGAVLCSSICETELIDFCLVYECGRRDDPFDFCRSRLGNLLVALGLLLAYNIHPPSSTLNPSTCNRFLPTSRLTIFTSPPPPIPITCCVHV